MPQRSRITVNVMVCAAAALASAAIVACLACGGGQEGQTAVPGGEGRTAVTQPTLAERQASGRKIFEQKCMVCHTVNGQGASGPGPDLTHESAPAPASSGLMDYRQFYSKWLDNPRFYLPDAKMPAYPLPPGQKQDLIEYLMTLT